MELPYSRTFIIVTNIFIISKRWAIVITLTSLVICISNISFGTTTKLFWACVAVYTRGGCRVEYVTGIAIFDNMCKWSLTIRCARYKGSTIGRVGIRKATLVSTYWWFTFAHEVCGWCTCRECGIEDGVRRTGVVEGFVLAVDGKI